MNDARRDGLLFLKQIGESEPEILLENVLPTVKSSAPVNTEESERKLTELAKVREIALSCVKCDLSKTRNRVVFGVGNPSAQLMFVGEAPGADEDRIGEPFVGRAGQLLDKIIAAMKLSRSDVYIANILKCRPPGNRNPSAFESECCKPFLKQQIDIVNPGVIVALGLVAAINLLELPPTTAVRDLRGRILEYHSKPLIVTYHPAALLRNPALKSPTWQDMQRVMRLLDGTETWNRES